MFTSKRPTCAGRTLDLPRKDRDIRYLRPLGNSDIANFISGRESARRADLGHFSDQRIIEAVFSNSSQEIRRQRGWRGIAATTNQRARKFTPYDRLQLHEERHNSLRIDRRHLPDRSAGGLCALLEDGVVERGALPACPVVGQRLQRRTSCVELSLGQPYPFHRSPPTIPAPIRSVLHRLCLECTRIEQHASHLCTIIERTSCP